jgi:hypothetical protein
MDLYEPLSSGEDEYLEPILVDFPPILTGLPYTPLDNTQNEIRLLQILPANEDSAHVCCLMDTHRLDAELVYSALSYTWGAANIARGVIVVNNHLALVTKNLSDALHRLRDDGVQKVWIDAVCIDQSNHEEKAQQVQNMGTIYQRADAVLSWIGPEDEDSERGIQAMGRAAATARYLQLQSVLDPYSDSSSPEQCRQMLERICKSLRDDSWLDEGDLERALNLTNRDYWQRIWVIQEISLARYVLIMCGTSQISWDEFQEAMTLFSWLRALSTHRTNSHNVSVAYVSSIVRVYRLVHWRPPPVVWISARLRSKGKYGTQLFHLMDEICNDTILKASDPRDRIYALLGLVGVEDQQGISVDYASPVPTVFAHSTLFLLRRHGPRVLMYSGLAHQNQEHGVLPSWAIDWSCTAARAAGLLENPMRDKPSLEPVQTTSDERLALRAAVRSQVVACVSFFVFPESITTLLKRIQGLMQAQQLPKRDLAVLKRTVWRTLLHGHYPRSLSARDIDSLFEDYIESGTLANFVRSIMPASPNDVLQVPPTPSGQEGAALNDGSTDRRLSFTFEDLLNNNKHARSIFVTEDGLIGSGPVMTKEGDVLCAIPECEVPFLLRRENGQEIDSSWKLLAPVYVDAMVATVGDGYFTMEYFWATNPDVEEVLLS